MTTVQQLHAVSEADVLAWHGVLAASVVRDLPGEPVPTLDQVQGQLTSPGREGRHLLWAAERGGVVVGVVRLRLSEGAGRDHLGQFTLHVHPDRRRAGVGRRLLGAVAEAAVRHGRRTLAVEASSDGAGAAFLEAGGFECVLALSLMMLKVADLDEHSLAEIVRTEHAGYRLVRWVGVVPGELAESFAAAKGSMGDMPVAGSGGADWDADRVREMAEVVEKRGDTLLTAAAITGGTVVGFTELVVPIGDGRRAIQYDTAVVPGHRGNGLALWVKAAMLEWLRGGWPGVREIETDNAEDNTHMLSVNERLGFRPLRQTRQYEARPEAILGLS